MAKPASRLPGPFIWVGVWLFGAVLMVYVFFTQVTVNHNAEVIRNNPVFLILAFIFMWIAAIAFVLARRDYDDIED